MKRIFLSYSRQNITFAERLARDLQDAGLDVWIDFRKIKGGEAWREAIFKGINQSDGMIVCLSEEAVKSEWVRREILMAHSQHKIIIPIMITDCLGLMPSYEETTYLLDFQILNFEQMGYEKTFPRLLEAIPGTKYIPVDEQSVVEIPNPFRGLEAFQQTNADIFFGREELIEKLLIRLTTLHQTRRFLAVVGASGSGKSSLVRAGLIPKIRQGHLPNSTTWPLVIFTPGANPTEAMGTRLQALFGESDHAELVARLNEHSENLHQLTELLLSEQPVTSRLVYPSHTPDS